MSNISPYCKRKDSYHIYSFAHLLRKSCFFLLIAFHSSSPRIKLYLENTKVSKAAALNNPSGRFLKDVAKVLAKPITELCNLSITSGKFPDSCKIAKLKPIYKKGSLTKASNYKPISLLPLMSKVTKKFIHNQTSAFLNSRNLLYNYQSGFRINQSTEFCLSFLNDNIFKCFDQGLMTGMILIDLQKAFDTIELLVSLNFR